MRVDIHFGIDLPDHSARIYDIRNTIRIVRIRKPGGAVSHGEAAVRVTEQGEGKRLLLLEPGVRFGRVRADAEYDHSALVKVRDSFPESLSLACSPRRVRPREKPQDYVSSPVLRKRMRVSALVPGRKVRCAGTLREQRPMRVKKLPHLVQTELEYLSQHPSTHHSALIAQHFSYSMVTFFMVTSSTGRSPEAVLVSAMASTVSCPWLTRPKIV